MSAYRHSPAQKKPILAKVEKLSLFPAILTVSVFGILSIFTVLPLVTFVAPGPVWAVVGLVSLLVGAGARKWAGSRARRSLF